MHLHYTRRLQRRKKVLERYGYVDDDDGYRRLVRHGKIGPQSREISAHALDALVQPNLAREPGGRCKPLALHCDAIGRKRAAVAAEGKVGKGFRRISASPTASVTGAPSTRPI